MPVEKIVSGGQTGADRGALDAAIALGIAHGGWCPQGRRAEDGAIPEHYQLDETESHKYSVRTQHNVTDADATLVFCRGTPAGGTRLTIRVAQRHGKPLLVIDPDMPGSMENARGWLAEVRPETLNVAGPRESQHPGIGALVRTFLIEMLSG